MTDKTVSVPTAHCGICGNKTPPLYQNSLGGICCDGCRTANSWPKEELKIISVSTESRMTAQQWLEDIEELLWSHEGHCLICNEPINCDCRPIVCGVHKADCPIPKVLDKIKALAEAASSSLLPVRQLETNMLEVASKENDERCARYGCDNNNQLQWKWRNPKTLPDVFDIHEAEAALMDAFIRQGGAFVWHGDGSSCAAQIVEAVWNRPKES